MPTLNFNIKYSVNSSLVLSADDIKERYLYGLPLGKNGQSIPDRVIEEQIASVTEQLEEFLSLKLKKQVITESHDFFSDDWKVWGYIPVMYPCVCAVSITGFLGTVKQVEYPKTWLSTKKSSDGKSYSRLLYLVPNTNSSQQDLIVYSGLLPNINYFSSQQIPNYWSIKYVTGYSKIPKPIINVIGKMVAMNIMAILSDTLLPFAGVSNNSISLDGVSQTIGYNANGIFSNRIKLYNEELFGKNGGYGTGEMKRLYDNYCAIRFTSL